MTAPTIPADAAWLVLSPDAVPPAWQGRAVPVALLPLLPGEASAMLAGETPPPGFAGEEDFLRLVARGLSRGEIADEMHLSRSSVARRLAALRAHFGVTTSAELVPILSRRGF